MSRIEVLSWDYNEQPDFERLGRLVAEMSGGRVHLTSVEDTGGQDYALVVSDEPLGQAYATEVYHRWYEAGARDD